MKFILCRVQDRKALEIHAKFVKKLEEAEENMKAANDPDHSASRARISPAGIAYRLMYPSTATEPVTTENNVMTGRGIP